jgi:hypothetical protein
LRQQERPGKINGKEQVKHVPVKEKHYQSKRTFLIYKQQCKTDEYKTNKTTKNTK